MEGAESEGHAWSGRNTIQSSRGMGVGLKITSRKEGDLKEDARSKRWEARSGGEEA